MKKLSYILAVSALAITGLSSCNPDKDPKIDTATDFEFVLNTPQLASQFIDLATNGKIEFTVSQPNYGVTVVPTYGIEISLKPDFTPVTDQPITDEEGEEHIVPGLFTLNLESQLKGILVAQMSDIASGINELNGVYDESSYTGDYVGPLYVRATAYLGSGTSAETTATVSNVIMLSQVQGYASFPANDIMTLSVPGGANGWNHLPQLAYFENESSDTQMVFWGFAVINGEFKITDGDWEGSGNWGAPDTGLVANADGTYTGKLIQNSQSNFNGDGALADGLYFIAANVTGYSSNNDNEEVGEIKLTPINAIYLPGDYNGWDAAGNPMSKDGEDFLWSASSSVTSAGWKFAMNGDWTINLGGDPERLWFNGDNLTLEGSTITLNLEQYPWTCTVQ
ncbi:MAG: hypothetical protein J1D77_06635 [Muribaculaceae bacterium]|nr:hypothetical protein [Muribaculaceae bacterium]